MCLSARRCLHVFVPASLTVLSRPAGRHTVLEELQEGTARPPPLRSVRCRNPDPFPAVCCLPAPESCQCRIPQLSLG